MPTTDPVSPSSSTNASAMPDLSPWFEALCDRDLPALKALIAGAPKPLPMVSDANGRTSTPLLLAIAEGWLAGFQAVLPVSDPNQANGLGDPPLSMALSFMTSTKNARAMVKALAPLVDVNRRDSNAAHPLEMAIEKGDVALFRPLLAHGALASTRPRSGGTLLHALISQIDLDGEHWRPLPFVQMWAVLVASGVDPDQLDERGRSAWAVLEAQPAERQRAIRETMVQQETEQMDRAMRTSTSVADAVTADAPRTRSRL